MVAATGTPSERSTSRTECGQPPHQRRLQAWGAATACGS